MELADARHAMIVSQLQPNQVLRSDVLEAFCAVPRERFVPPGYASAAYLDEDIPLGQGRFMLETVSFAKLLLLADPAPADRVLYVGGGLGYGPAIMSHMADTVVAVEERHDLLRQAREILPGYAKHKVAISQRALVIGDQEHAPYDLIFIEGAIQHLPAELPAQLNEGGRIACFFRAAGLPEEAPAQARLYQKKNGRVYHVDDFQAFVPTLREFTESRGFSW